jgi:ABC-type transport system involved in Fe-S cluster assembly fused permease/ATPase subunit
MDTDGYIIACVFITAFVALCVLVMMVLHRFYWKRLYHKAPSNEKKGFKFMHDKWYNYECDKYFHEKIENAEELIL